MLVKQSFSGVYVNSSASGVDVCVVAVQRGPEGLSSSHVPLGPGEGAALQKPMFIRKSVFGARTGS